MRLKFCGIKNADELQYCVDLGVDYVGINFYEKSPRFCKNGNILDFFDKIDLKDTKLVAVVVDAGEALLSKIIGYDKFYALQFAGSESPSLLESYLGGSCRVWKAVGGGSDALAYANSVDLLIFDSSCGTGTLFSDKIIKTAKPFAVAGGIGCSNVRDFMARYPDADFLDMASGVEDAESGVGKRRTFSRAKAREIANVCYSERLHAETRRCAHLERLLEGGGRYGKYGGAFIPEILKPIFDKINDAFVLFKGSQKHQQEFMDLLKNYAGRPTPLYFCENLTQMMGGAKIYAKREDLLHGGAHKTNNVVGQMIVAKIIDAKEVLCETGAGQHGVAVAMCAAKFGMRCTIFMGSKDIARQEQNVLRMKMFGATVVPVVSGSASLKDAVNESMRHWAANPDMYYVFGTASGPHPFPEMVSYFQKIIGIEARQQMLNVSQRLPRAVVASVGGGSNAMGIFQGFLADRDVRLIGVEPAGDGVGTDRHGMSIQKGRFGCIHGSLQSVLCDNNGNICESHSVSAGLDYPGVSPIHSYLWDIKRADYVGIDDREAVDAYKVFALSEGILPALESSHAIAHVVKIAKHYSQEDILLFNLSGRGDKDINTVFNFGNKDA